jgi:FlaA1/EpsC-like NDP-sugar epimerase
MAQKIILLVLGDVLVSILALFIAFLIGTSRETQTPGTVMIFLFISVTLFSSYFLELYSRKRVFRISLKEMPAIIFLGLTVSFFILTSIFFMFPSIALGRRWLILSLANFGLLQFVWHYFYKSILNLTGMKQKVLVLGTGNLARKMEQIMFLHKTHYAFAGYYDLPGTSLMRRAGRYCEKRENR